MTDGMPHAVLLLWLFALLVAADNREAPNRALIIVDVQPDFLPGGRLPTKDGFKILDPLLQLLQAAINPGQHHRQNSTQEHVCYSAIVFSADKHPPGHISFARHADSSSHLELYYRLDGSLCGCGQPCVSVPPPKPVSIAQAAGSVIGASQRGACIWRVPHEQLVGVQQQLWPPHCIRGTEGGTIHQALLETVQKASAAARKLGEVPISPANLKHFDWLPLPCAFDDQGLATPTLCTLAAPSHTSEYQQQPEGTHCPSPPVLVLHKGTLDYLDDYSAFASVGHLQSTGGWHGM